MKAGWYWTYVLALFCSACAIKPSTVAEPDSEPRLPEVRTITFQGNAHFSRWSLLGVLATKPRSAFSPWKRGEPYNPATVETDLRRLKKFYFERGYLEMSARLEAVREDPEANAVDMDIRIEEGEPTLVTAVDITGTFPLGIPSKNRLLGSLVLRVGQPINKADFDQSQAILLSHLQHAGYARAQVTPRTEVDPQAHTAHVSWDLKPGARTRLGEIRITGAKQVRERAIRRQLTLREGQLYSPKALEKTTGNIYALGMFQAVNPQARNLGEANAPLDIDIAVRERQQRTFQFGLGFSTIDSLRLQIEWIHRNLFQGAESLSLSAKASGVEQGMEVRLNLPYVLVERMSFTQTLFATNHQKLELAPFDRLDELFNIEDPFPAFDLLTTGGRSRLGYQLAENLTSWVGLELSRNDFREVDIDALEASEEEIAKDNTLLLQFAELQWDTSDDLLNPTQGWLMRGRFEHSYASVLSDASFVKLLLEMRYYRPLRRHTVLAGRLMIGSIQPYGESDEVPLNVRFFSGGPGSVRGFAINRLGPLDQNGDPIGGNSLIEGNLEWRFPIVRNLGGAIFIDFGQVFDQSFTYHFNQLRFAAGPGFRFNTPVGPLRLDAGFIIDSRADEPFGRVEFSIGQAF